MSNNAGSNNAGSNNAGSNNTRNWEKNQSFVSKQKVQQEAFALKTQVAAGDHRPRH